MNAPGIVVVWISTGSKCTPRVCVVGYSRSLPPCTAVPSPAAMTLLAAATTTGMHGE